MDFSGLHLETCYARPAQEGVDSLGTCYQDYLILHTSLALTNAETASSGYATYHGAAFIQFYPHPPSVMTPESSIHDSDPTPPAPPDDPDPPPAYSGDSLSTSIPDSSHALDSDARLTQPAASTAGPYANDPFSVPNATLQTFPSKATSEGDQSFRRDSFLWPVMPFFYFVFTYVACAFQFLVYF